MLLKPGRAAYLVLCIFLVLIFTSVQDKPRAVIHDGWRIAQQTLGQRHSIADHSIINRPKQIEIVESEAEEPSPYAYVFYATSDTYACSILVNIHQLLTAHKTPHRIFVLASYQVSLVYIQAMEQLDIKVTLQTPPPIPLDSPASSYYADCLLKLYAFQMHHVDASLRRIVVLDADVLILKSLDYVFEIEGDLLAAPAYWVDEKTVSTAFMVASLDNEVWEEMEEAMKRVGYDMYDMDLVNHVLGDRMGRLGVGSLALNSHWETWKLPAWFLEDGGQGTESDEVGKVDKGDEVGKVDLHAIAAQESQATSIDLSGGKSETNVSISSASPPKKSLDLDPPIGKRKSYDRLFDLYDTISVLHFTALDKPWKVNNETVEKERPDAHSLFKEQFSLWREVAKEVCPADVVDVV